MDAAAEAFEEGAVEGIFAFIRRAALEIESIGPAEPRKLPISVAQRRVGEAILDAADREILDEILEDAALAESPLSEKPFRLRVSMIRKMVADTEQRAGAIRLALNAYLGPDAGLQAAHAIDQGLSILRLGLQVPVWLKLTDEQADAWLEEKQGTTKESERRTRVEVLYDQSASVEARRMLWALALVVPAGVALAIAIERRQKIEGWIAHRLGEVFGQFAGVIRSLRAYMLAKVEGREIVKPEPAPVDAWFHAAREAGGDEYWPLGPPDAEAG